MGVVVGVLVGSGVLVAVAVLGAMAASGRVAAAGREGGALLVAPRGAGFGEASRLVLDADRAARAGTGLAEVVHLHEHRGRRGAAPAHDAA